MGVQQVFALTADQQGSRRHGDQVPQALTALAAVPSLLPAERTAGDELQLLLRDAPAAVDAVCALLRLGGWRLGLGIGTVDEPLPASTRAASGEAYLRAREAVEAADNVQVPVQVMVRASSVPAAEHATTALWYLHDILSRRTAAGWEAADTLAQAGTARAAAATLRIDAGSLSRRLRTARVEPERRARALAVHLLATAAEGAP